MRVFETSANTLEYGHVLRLHTEGPDGELTGPTEWCCVTPSESGLVFCACGEMLVVWND